MSILRKSQEWGWWLHDLEQAIGPIVSGRTYVIAGRPSCGKTMFLQNLAWQLSRRMEGDPVMLMAWTERGEEPALISLASLIDGLNENLCLRQKWNELPDGSERKIEERVQGFRDTADMFPILDVACPTSDEIYYALQRHKPSIFIFDYLQNVTPMPGQTDWGAIYAAMGHCTEYAKNGGTVFIGSQLKRRGDGIYDKYRPPHMDDFLGGGKIEAGANVALGLYRPLKPMTLSDEKEVKAGRRDLEQWKQHGVMGVKVLKHTFAGDAADRIVRVKVLDNRRVVDYEYREPIVDRGDAWEAPF